MKFFVSARTNALCWLLILFGLLGMLVELMFSGRIVYFLHPRMYNFVWLGIMMLLVLSGHQIYVLVVKHHLFRKRPNTNRSLQPLKLGILVFLLPILLAAAKPEMMNSDVLTNKALIMGQNAIVETTQATTESTENLSVSENPLDTNPDDFYTMMTQLQTDFKIRVGEEISFKGVVYRQDNFTDKQIVVSRLLITCCASDAGVLGILVEGEKALDEFANDSWVEVTGTIAINKYHDKASDITMDLPMLKITKINKIEPFDNPYVYPN